MTTKTNAGNPGEKTPENFETAEFVTSLVKAGTLPQLRGGEVALAGRSNAGKSSVLNALCNRRNLARASKTPGRTRAINYFRLQSGSTLVDLPGYGYAKASHKEQEAWSQLVNFYLQNSPALMGVVIVMDSRRPLQPGDQQMIEWCAHAMLPTLLLLNKSDKLKRGAMMATKQRVIKEVTGRLASVEVIEFSALKKTGVERTRELLSNWMQGFSLA